MTFYLINSQSTYTLFPIEIIILIPLSLLVKFFCLPSPVLSCFLLSIFYVVTMVLLNCSILSVLLKFIIKRKKKRKKKAIKSNLVHYKGSMSMFPVSNPYLVWIMQSNSSC